MCESLPQVHIRDHASTLPCPCAGSPRVRRLSRLFDGSRISGGQLGKISMVGRAIEIANLHPRFHPHRVTSSTLATSGKQVRGLVATLEHAVGVLPLRSAAARVFHCFTRDIETLRLLKRLCGLESFRCPMT